MLSSHKDKVQNVYTIDHDWLFYLISILCLLLVLTNALISDGLTSWLSPDSSSGSLSSSFRESLLVIPLSCFSHSKEFLNSGIKGAGLSLLSWQAWSISSTIWFLWILFFLLVEKLCFTYISPHLLRSEGKSDLKSLLRSYLIVAYKLSSPSPEERSLLLRPISSNWFPLIVSADFSPSVSCSRYETGLFCFPE